MGGKAEQHGCRWLGGSSVSVLPTARMSSAQRSLACRAGKGSRTVVWASGEGPGVAECVVGETHVSAGTPGRAAEVTHGCHLNNPQGSPQGAPGGCPESPAYQPGTLGVCLPWAETEVTLHLCLARRVLPGPFTWQQAGLGSLPSGVGPRWLRWGTRAEVT